MTLRKEKQDRWAAWMPDPAPPEAEGYTADGFIRSQDCFSTRTYRTMPACINCCGCVAAYNLRRARGQSPDFGDVLREMDGMHLLCIPGPTRMAVMRRYLTKYLPGWRETRGRERCFAAAHASAMGLFRYHEEGVPHFVAYMRAGENTFRFLNIGEGAWDDAFTVGRFGAEHCVSGPVRLIWWDD